MKKALIIALSVITLPFESAAYLIARIVKMQGGEKFVAWKTGENWEIETVLSGEELKKHLKSLK